MTSFVSATQVTALLFRWVGQVFLLLLFTLCLPAQAIYQCRIDGSLTYTDRPCGSESRIVPVAPPSHGSRLSADVLRHEKTEITRLQRLREQRERQDQQIRDLAARGAAARERKCQSMALQLRWREEDLRDATLQEAKKARVRARRAAEKLAQECQ